MVVIEFAKSNRATCRTCNKFIDKDEMKLGTALRNDGYMNIEWHHAECFWTKRAAKYYLRNGKKINILLKEAQFSGQHVLDADGKKDLLNRILECNLRWGTPAALEKEGIPAPEKEAAPAKPKAKRGKKAEENGDAEEVEQPKKGKRKAAPKVENEEEEEAAPENSGRKKRKTK